MTFTEAHDIHHDQWEGLTSYVFPFNYRYMKEEFIEVDISIVNCEKQQVEDERVDKYKKLLGDGVDLGPSWVSFGKLLRCGELNPHWHSKLYVLDGNHRLSAAKLLNRKTVTVIIPKIDYTYYKRHYNE